MITVMEEHRLLWLPSQVLQCFLLSHSESFKSTLKCISCFSGGAPLISVICNQSQLFNNYTPTKISNIFNSNIIFAVKLFNNWTCEFNI